jgi:hypothetical protein
MSGWINDDSSAALDRLLDDLSSAQPAPMPRTCPICGHATAHAHFHGRGLWLWCSHCRHYSHGTGRAPAWWRDTPAIDASRLRHDPEYLDAMAMTLDAHWDTLVAPGGLAAVWTVDDSAALDAVASEVENGAPLPRRCPICEWDAAHLCFQQGMRWIWCSHCRHYRHGAATPPTWWQDARLLAGMTPGNDPRDLDTLAGALDDYCNALARGRGVSA